MVHQCPRLHKCKRGHTKDMTMRGIYAIAIIILTSFTAYCQGDATESPDGGNINSRWIRKGYRGFVETGAGGDVKDSKGSFFVSTTHGRQFSRCFFWGGGFGFVHTTTKQYYRVPDNPTKFYYSDPHNTYFFYMDMRFTVPTRCRFYPYADFKIGLGGVVESLYYINWQIGARYALNRTLGLTAGLYCTNLQRFAAAAPIIGVAVGFDF